MAKSGLRKALEGPQLKFALVYVRVFTVVDGLGTRAGAAGGREGEAAVVRPNYPFAAAPINCTADSACHFFSPAFSWIPSALKADLAATFQLSYCFRGAGATRFTAYHELFR